MRRAGRAGNGPSYGPKIHGKSLGINKFHGNVFQGYPENMNHGNVFQGYKRNETMMRIRIWMDLGIAKIYQRKPVAEKTKNPSGF